jgi:hypothetical protein
LQDYHDAYTKFHENNRLAQELLMRERQTHTVSKTSLCETENKGENGFCSAKRQYKLEYNFISETLEDFNHMSELLSQGARI